MKKYRTRMMLIALLGFLVSASYATPSLAETGAVSVVFTKGGFIVGVGGGQGVLTFRGKHYPFTVSGMSVGFTIGASTTKFVGRALNLHSPSDLAGSYVAGGAGGALAAHGSRRTVRLRLPALVGPKPDPAVRAVTKRLALGTAATA